MRRARSGSIVPVFVALVGFCAFGFSNVAPGDALPEKTLPGLDGRPRPYLPQAKVTVFFFVTPTTRNCQLALRELAGLEKELAGRGVAFVPLVSGAVADGDTTRELADAGLQAVPLKDEGDALYGALGAALTPVVGVADEQHRLLAYLPFKKLNYADAVRAWVRFGLGELSKEQLAALLTPAPVADGGEAQVAHRYLRLAEKQLQAGHRDQALANVKKSLERDPASAAAHALFGAVLVAEGRCDEARAPLARALELDPGQPMALEARKGCGADGGVALDGGVLVEGRGRSSVH
jgi:tetratricopeptide (TPR) repeat protein